MDIDEERFSPRQQQTKFIQGNKVIKISKVPEYIPVAQRAYILPHEHDISPISKSYHKLGFSPNLELSHQDDNIKITKALPIRTGIINNYF